MQLGEADWALIWDLFSSDLCSSSADASVHFHWEDNSSAREEQVRASSWELKLTLK